MRIAQHNVEAALDSIRYLKDANGNLYAEKKSFIATISELKELNTEMYENIQSLQKKLQKKILAGSDIGVVDTIYPQFGSIYFIGTFLFFIGYFIRSPYQSDTRSSYLEALLLVQKRLVDPCQQILSEIHTVLLYYPLIRICYLLVAWCS